MYPEKLVYDVARFAAALDPQAPLFPGHSSDLTVPAA
jgi:hypothetical protein